MAKRRLTALSDPVPPEELRDWRRKRGWTQAQAARYLGVSQRTIENWEQGYRPMRHPVAMKKLMAQARINRREEERA